MSDDAPGSFAPPPFRPPDALQQLKRALRDLKLAERGIGFELRGKRVLELEVDGATIRARIARKPALTSDWDKQLVQSATDQRKLLEEIKKRLARWETEE